MYRPSGITIVTAGLGALALFQVNSGRGIRHAELPLREDAPLHREAFDPGAAFQLHSGAWRAWSAHVESEPSTASEALSAPEVPAGTSESAMMVPKQSAAIQRSSVPRTVPPRTAAAGVAVSAESPPPLPTAVPIPPMPPPEGRMALAGPKDLETPPVSVQPHSSPRTQDRASAAPSAIKVSPAFLKEIERNGF
jgi:hypothetical protein